MNTNKTVLLGRYYLDDGAHSTTFTFNDTYRFDLHNIKHVISNLDCTRNPLPLHCGGGLTGLIVDVRYVDEIDGVFSIWGLVQFNNTLKGHRVQHLLCEGIFSMMMFGKAVNHPHYTIDRIAGWALTPRSSTLLRKRFVSVI